VCWRHIIGTIIRAGLVISYVFYRYVHHVRQCGSSTPNGLLLGCTLCHLYNLLMFISIMHESWCHWSYCAVVPTWWMPRWVPVHNINNRYLKYNYCKALLLCFKADEWWVSVILVSRLKPTECKIKMSTFFLENNLQNVDFFCMNNLQNVVFFLHIHMRC
jgi:hypothetical protein